LKFQYLLLILFAFSCSSPAPKRRTDKLSILQGITNTKEVEFSVVAQKGKVFKFELRTPEDQVINPEETKIVGRPFSDYEVHKILFVRDPKKDYNFFVYEADKLIDQRLVGRGQQNRNHLRVAIASCMDDNFQDKFRIWDELAKKNPEYVLLIGDNVYSEKGLGGLGKKLVVDDELLWKRYVDIRLTLPYYFQEKLIPTHGLWDDHDYGARDGGADYEYKEQSKEIFETFFAQSLSDDEWFKGFGVGGLLTLGDFNLYFLDSRFYRSTDKNGAHLGLDQYGWLMSKINEEQTPSLLIEGDQFFGGYHSFDSYEGNHPREFAKFSEDLKKVQAPFVFISGDRHMSEIMQFPRSLFGKPSFEITASPIHAKTFPDSQDVNPWRVIAQKKDVSFTMMDNVAKDDHWFMEVENIGETGTVYYKRELAVFIKDLQNNLNEVRKRRSGRRRYRHTRTRKGRR
jgi:alkaline phosphatase D